jgi:transposase
VARKVKQIRLSEEQQSALESGYRSGDSHCFRQRCKMVLLKEEGYRSTEIATILSTNEMSVNNWINRFVKDGLKGLETKAGRGRKPILKEEHLSIVKAAVEQERQRLSQAQQIIEDSIGRPMSKETLSRFLKVITAVTSASENDQKENVTKRITSVKCSNFNCWSSVVSWKK